MTTLAFHCCTESRQTYMIEEEKLGGREAERGRKNSAKIREVRVKLVAKAKKEM